MSTSAKTRYHHGDLRAALLKAAEDLLAEGGVPAVGLREVARRVGVSATAPYRHFADKEALLAAVAAEGFRALGQAMGAAAAGAGAPRNALGAAYVRFALAQPARFRLMFGQGVAAIARHPDLAAAARMTHGFLTRSAATPLAAVHDWAMVHGLANLLIDGMLGEVDAETLLVAFFGPADATPSATAP